MNDIQRGIYIRQCIGKQLVNRLDKRQVYTILQGYSCQNNCRVPCKDLIRWSGKVKTGIAHIVCSNNVAIQHDLTNTQRHLFSLSCKGKVVREVERKPEYPIVSTKMCPHFEQCDSNFACKGFLVTYKLAKRKNILKTRCEIEVLL